MLGKLYKVLFSLLLILSPTAVFAEPITAGIAWFAATIGTSVAVATIVLQVAFVVATSVYGAASARRAARAAAEKARSDYNAGLQDRTITSVATNSPLRTIYGEARVGSSIVAIFTSGDKDQYKHLVCVHAAHECESIGEMYIAGIQVGPLDAYGQPTSGKFMSGETTQGRDSMSGSSTMTLSHIPLAGTLTLYMPAFEGEAESQFGGWTLVGNVITLPPGYTEATAIYQYYTGTPRVRISKHLGGSSDPADAYLRAELGSLWPETSVLRGYCYTVVRLDINQSEFQGGIPSIEAVIKGKKLYDPRSTLTVYSDNPSLVIYDYLTSDICGVQASSLPTSQFITAANVCDEILSDSKKRYTINGTVTSDQNQSQVLEQMTQAMAGSLVATTWDIYAGKYVAPVMALDQSDIVGSLSMSPGISDADIFNGVKGQYVSTENLWVSTDYKPFQNATYKATDGRDLWNSIDMPFTNSLQRVHNICRIFVEDQRNCFTIKADFSLKAWSLRVGQRVTFNSTFFGQTNKIYRVTDKKYSPTSVVELTLKEDAPSIWDESDTTVIDDTPNTNLPDPFKISPLGSLTCYSGTNALLLQSDGTVVSRVLVSWPAVTTQSVFNNGYVEVQYNKVGTDVWNTAQFPGDSVSGFVSGVEDARWYTFRARAVNPSFNVKSDWTYAVAHLVIGKTAPPNDVVGLTYAFENFGVRINWQANTDIDIGFYEVRRGGTSWETSTKVYLSKSTSFFDKSLASGTVNYFVKAIDTTGNYSLNAATIAIAIPVPETTSATASISGPAFVLSWAVVAGAFAIDYFEIRYGASWAAGTLQDKVKTIGYSQNVNYGGSRTYWIAAVDVAGNVGIAASVTVTISNPLDAVLTTQVIDNNVLLNWSDSKTTLPIQHYDVRKGTSWATSISIGDNGNGRFAAFFENVSGMYTYWVQATDSAGNTSVPTSTTATVDQPPDYILRLDYNTNFDGDKYEFVSGTDTLGWAGSGATVAAGEGTLTVTSTSTNPIIRKTMNAYTLYGCEYPTIKVKIRRVAGSGWDGLCYYTTSGHGESTSYYKLAPESPPSVGQTVVLTFDMTNLTAGGTDWQASIIDTVRFDFGTTTSDIFQVDWIQFVPYTSSNVTLDRSMLYAALTQETWQDHFVNNSWTTPQDQITAGFPYYWQKSNNTGWYEEVINYGTVIPSSTITLTLSSEILSGAVTVVPQISFKTAWGDAWTDRPGVSATTGTNFQFIKIRYDFTASGGDDLLNITRLNVKIAAKSKNDAGSGTALSTDSGGTTVNFVTPFVDVTSITVTGAGTTAPVIPIYDFVDIPNPTFFKVLLYDKDGTRVSGGFSWAAKGV